jgi:hypothetical protein
MIEKNRRSSEAKKEGVGPDVIGFKNTFLLKGFTCGRDQFGHPVC